MPTPYRMFFLFPVSLIHSFTFVSKAWYLYTYVQIKEDNCHAVNDDDNNNEHAIILNTWKRSIHTICYHFLFMNYNQTHRQVHLQPNHNYLPSLSGINAMIQLKEKFARKVWQLLSVSALTVIRCNLEYCFLLNCFSIWQVNFLGIMF